jgi:hypothetical protein
VYPEGAGHRAWRGLHAADTLGRMQLPNYALEADCVERVTAARMQPQLSGTNGGGLLGRKGRVMAASRAGSSRRTLLKTVAAATAAGGTISILDQLTGGITRAEANTTTPAHDEQYLVDGLEAISDNGVHCIVPPLYKYIITGKLKRDRTWTAAELQKARARLEKAFVQAEAGRPRTAAGLTLVVAWGLPYFRNFIKPLIATSTWNSAWPRTADGSADAVLDAIRFSSDPSSTILEDNEVMVMIRSDSPIILDDVKGKLFHNTASDGYIGDIIDVTSERTGFVGRGFDKPSVAKQLAQKAGVAGADAIPAGSQLMMGFTSTQKAALGPENIASFETLGLTTVKPGDYFACGAAMHLSHIYEDLGVWYGKGYGERTSRMFSPRTTAGDGTVTLPNGADQVSTLKEVTQDSKKGPGGHNSLLQQATRLGSDATDVYGKARAKGTPVPVREDFNTLDAPFTTSANPSRDGWSGKQNRPGLHFVVFVPASGRFHAARKAMDGELPDGTKLGDPKTNGINPMLTTTHRQNYLVPPRSHRSLPMAELL